MGANDQGAKKKKTSGGRGELRMFEGPLENKQYYDHEMFSMGISQKVEVTLLDVMEWLQCFCSECVYTMSCRSIKFTLEIFFKETLFRGSS